VRPPSPSRAKRATLVVLAAGYGGLWLSIGHSSFDRRFDPLNARGRHVEEAIETGRFADALPVTLGLREAFPDQPQVAYWLAEIFRGLDRPRDEADAWDTFVAMTPTRAAACPAWPQAHTRAGHDRMALHAYEQCVAFAPDDPERLIDLADALAAHGRLDAARAAYAGAAALDRTDPRPTSRLRELTLVEGR
jgi:thioredoxin-like negative regulator of GroEL